MRRSRVLALIYEDVSVARFQDGLASKARACKREGHTELHDAHRDAERAMRELRKVLWRHVHQHESVL